MADVTNSTTRHRPPFRLFVAGLGAGIVLMVLGVFVSNALIGLGAGLIVLIPLGYAVRQVARHAYYQPEQRYDPSYIEDVSRMIERSGRSRGERRPGRHT
jgi:hypothetical protein